MDSNQFTPTSAQINDAESMAYAFEMLLSGCYFFEIAKVVAVRGSAPNLVVDVLPLVTKRDRSGAMIRNSTIYDLPVFRLQRGNSAIIMNPVVGDIGLIAVADRDTSLVRANLKESLPGSDRKHSKSDAHYLGGILNQEPTQYIEFADGAINITSPNPVNINCSKANVIAPDGVDMTTPLLHIIGGGIKADKDITDNAGTQSSTVAELRDAHNDHDHEVKNVQTGTSTITSEKPSEQV